MSIQAAADFAGQSNCMTRASHAYCLPFGMYLQLAAFQHVMHRYFKQVVAFMTRETCIYMHVAPGHAENAGACTHLGLPRAVAGQAQRVKRCKEEQPSLHGHDVI